MGTLRFEVEGRRIGEGCPVYIVAEISANHGQSFTRAVSLIKEAKKCGADAVKFQTYTPDTLTLDEDNKYFRIDHPRWGGKTLHQLYEKAFTPWKWFKSLKRVADDAGIAFFSTAFDATSVDFLEGLGVPIHKISSFELVDPALIKYAAKTGKALMLSAGMASLPEIGEAVAVARKAGAMNVCLLKCVSCYPARPEEMNLKTIPDMKKRFGCPVGLSDHTLGIGTSVAAVALGAQVIEKHFTLSRRLKTPDSFFSIEPRELKELVDNVRMAEKALGRVHYGLTEDEKKSRVFRRSLFAVTDVKKGDVFTGDNVRSIRPGHGLLPRYLDRVIGKRARVDIARGTPLAWRHVGKK
ncbi:MAG: pseudaminic acid synthase [Candidatus Aureabacteria bacterium]|nr:pseudaminic acid synthase [Candidatus Auribacterota bacterium]